MLLAILFVSLFFQASHAQSSLLILVSPGPPLVPNITHPHRKPIIPDMLSANGARQQYTLGLELSSRYQKVFEKLAFNFSFGESSTFRAFSKSGGVARASAQALLQGLLSKRKGPQVSVLNPEVFTPPYINHVMDKLNSSTLPQDLLVGKVVSYSEQGYNLLGEFEATCEEVFQYLETHSRETFKTYKDLPLPDNYIMPWVPPTEKPDLEDYFLYYHFVAASRANKRDPIVEEARYQTLRKIALLNLTSQISEQSRRVSRLKTKEIYTELKKLGNHTTAKPTVKNVSVMHLTDDQFITVMDQLKMTSTDCLADLLRAKSSEELANCQSYPPYSSTIVFEFLSAQDGQKKADLKLRILYNGKVYAGFSDPPEEAPVWESVDEQLRQALFVSDEEYYCQALRKAGTLSQKLMLSFMFFCIVLLGAALLVYMTTNLSSKHQMIEEKYKEFNRRMYFATSRSID